ncbi:MAG TPA: hypothetical protein VL866_24225 [Pyrinomonadaceae bacterium]|nr:hypothetical protein [Pyrinomonadaceae bacterium]
MSIASSLRRRARKSSSFILRSGPRPEKTYWNGEPANCRRVIVRVGTVEKPTWWCADMEGTERVAVEVNYGKQTFYLDDENGSAWGKVTGGMGGPEWGHKSLPDDSEVIRER